jgi:hypothetical protein
LTEQEIETGFAQLDADTAAGRATFRLAEDGDLLIFESPGSISRPAGSNDLARHRGGIIGSTYQRDDVVRGHGADQEAAMNIPPNIGHDLRGAEQRNRDKRARMQDEATRRAQLGIQRSSLRGILGRWYRRLTGSKPSEH